jgi:frataxin-like iron-binding protein CyaY
LALADETCKKLEESTPAINRISGDFWKFDGVRQIIVNKSFSRKVWISSWLGGTWIDCASGIYPTKIDYRHSGVTETISRLML